MESAKWDLIEEIQRTETKKAYLLLVPGLSWTLILKFENSSLPKTKTLGLKI